MNRLLFAGPLLAALGLAAALSLQQAPRDYTTIPPDPTLVIKELEALPTSLAKAIEIAQKEVGGLAISASIDRDAKPVSIAVDVYSSKFLSRVNIDAQSGKITQRADSPRFGGDPVSGEWIELPSGLKYFELKVGDGPSPVSIKNPVSLVYTAWLVDGTKVDSTLDQGGPLVIAPKKLITGMEEGLRSMKVGGKRKLIMPYDLAYGIGGKPPMVPPKATLVVDLELIALP